MMAILGICGCIVIKRKSVQHERFSRSFAFHIIAFDRFIGIIKSFGDKRWSYFDDLFKKIDDFWLQEMNVNEQKIFDKSIYYQ